MAITTTSRIAGPFIGNDTATVFPFTFKVFLATDLFVITDLNGILVLGTDYTVALNDNQDVSPGGSVTLLAGPLATGTRMTITSDVAELQQVILTNLGGFFPDVLNDALDRLTILVQQLQSGVNQSIKFGLTDDLTTAQLPPASQRANKFLFFGSDGSLTLSTLAPTAGTALLFSGALTGKLDGNNKIFTITDGGVPIGVAPVKILVWNNFPIPPSGYTLGPSPGEITFTVAPAADAVLEAQGEYVPAS